VKSLFATFGKCALLARSEMGLLVLHMHENYWHRTPAGRVVSIGRSSRDHSRWAVWLDGVFRSDVFVGAEEAAACASKADFHDDAAVEKFRGTRVPWNLDDWHRNPPGPWTPGAVSGRN
jgi:hypothetical protein